MRNPYVAHCTGYLIVAEAGPASWALAPEKQVLRSARLRRAALRACPERSEGMTSAGRSVRKKTVEVAVLPNRRPNQPRERRERRLRGVQPEPKVRVVIRRVEIGGLVPIRVPPCPDLRAALVLAQADRRHVILERRGVGVRHV